ncbi:unnamed protein product [Pleuronectes platessa]|uniref:Uncharacterized protein n=1 Tax=Pleuronectes platessa TaxID=8262 RepID=A0A9N7UTD9_PLEPL|nr:unnamed protein product [Pleuronectes platessa]
MLNGRRLVSTVFSPCWVEHWDKKEHPHHSQLSNTAEDEYWTLLLYPNHTPTIAHHHSFRTQTTSLHEFERMMIEREGRNREGVVETSNPQQETYSRNPSSNPVPSLRTIPQQWTPSLPPLSRRYGNIGSLTYQHPPPD